MDLHDGDERCIEVVVFGFLGVQDLDGESTTGDGEDGTTVEIACKLFSI